MCVCLRSVCIEHMYVWAPKSTRFWLANTRTCTHPHPHTHTHAHMHTCTCVYIYIEEDPRETIRIVWGFQLYEVLSKLRVTVSGRCFVNVGQGGTTTPLSISEI